MNQTYLLILLAILSTIAPMSIATYLPAMPIMAEHFDTTISNIELSLSIFMFGFSLGQLFGGVLSDTKGRKLSSLIGLIGFCIFSILIISASSIYELWIYRFLQAFFGGLTVINSTAIVRDLYKGKEAARFFSLLGSVRSIVPVIAPLIGTFILLFFNWQGIFVFLSLFSLVLIILIIKDLKESYTYKKINIIQSYKSVLIHKKAMMMIFIIALGFSGLFSLVTKASFIYIEYYKIGINAFPFYYGLSFIFVIIFSSLNVKLIKKYSQINILHTVIVLQIVFALLFIIFYSIMNVYFATLLIALYLGMNGLIFGNATALAMENFPQNAGVASALIGVIQFGLASIISSSIVFFNSHSLLPIGLAMIFISLTAFIILKKYKQM